MWDSWFEKGLYEGDCLVKRPFFVSIPHSGENIPPEVNWLQNLPEPIQMCDVDRYVDVLYLPALEQSQIPYVVTEWHRYFADLNRLPEDVDQSSVVGASQPAGAFPLGFLWTKTTNGDPLLSKPISQDLHRQLALKYWQPFHDQVVGQYKKFHGMGFKKVYQLDAHSMPSIGTSAHKDPGENRAEIVVSDFHGNSCEAPYRELVINAYRNAGFEVKLNWPYVGGRVTQTYGVPDRGQHCLQVEMNRSLYMNERTKRQIPERVNAVQEQLKTALQEIGQKIGDME